MKITNEFDISLPLAVWLLHDNYDYINDENYISATTLMRSTKQLVLSRRIKSEDRIMDVSEKIAATLGHSIHDSIEQAWKNPEHLRYSMKALGYPEKVYDNIRINPTPEYLQENPDCIPVYIENRAKRQITVRGTTFTVGGKLDMAINGHLFDFKSTSVWTWIKGRKDEDYALQGGLYRWLNEDKITEDHININFVFTDWQRGMTRTEGYPQQRVQQHLVELLPLDATERYIEGKLSELTRCWDLPESELPECTDKELWRSDPVYKYYTDPEKAKDPTARSSKNFDTLQEANAHRAEKAKGVVVTVPGAVKACGYCPAFEICEQRKRYDVV